MLLRPAYLGVTNALALLRLLPMSNRDKDTEILAPRHQIMVLERQLDGERVQFTPTERGWRRCCARYRVPCQPSSIAANT